MVQTNYYYPSVVETFDLPRSNFGTQKLGCKHKLLQLLNIGKGFKNFLEFQNTLMVLMIKRFFF